MDKSFRYHYRFRSKTIHMQASRFIDLATTSFRYKNELQNMTGFQSGVNNVTPKMYLHYIHIFVYVKNKKM